MERVSLVLDRWQQEAERTGKGRVQNLLRNAFRPLHDGLDEIAAIKDGEDTYEEEAMASAGEEGASEDLVWDYRKLETRREAVLALLKDAELRVIFHYIGAFENDPLPDRTKGGNEWSWWASRYLETEYGLVEKHGWGYRLTERGHRVETVLRNLEELSLQKRLGLGAISTAEAVLQLLPITYRATAGRHGKAAERVTVLAAVIGGIVKLIFSSISPQPSQQYVFLGVAQRVGMYVADYSKFTETFGADPTPRDEASEQTLPSVDA